MEDREAIIGALPPAGRKARVPLPSPPLPKLGTESLWQMFASRFGALNGRIGTIEDVEILMRRSYIVDHEAAARMGVSPGGTPVWEAEVGITMADLAIAETGSLLLSAGPGKSRMVSLTPPNHVVLIPRDRIVATLAEGFARLSDRTTVMITGPSRTADIEGVLVRGVHGPKEIMVVLI